MHRVTLVGAVPSVWRAILPHAEGRDLSGIRKAICGGGAMPQDLRAAYLRADVFCQPGTAELQSLVTLEAMAASRPVVLADARALPHLAEDGVNGWLFTPGDAQDLARKLALVLQAPAGERERMGRESRRKVAQHSFPRTLETFLRLYRGQYPEPARPRTPGAGRLRSRLASLVR